MDKINQWLNQQPYNITVRVSFTPGVEPYTEPKDVTVNRTIDVQNEIAHMDFLEQEIADLASYDLALELITRAKEQK